MHTWELDRYGEEYPEYDPMEEGYEHWAAFLEGRYGGLTAKEIAYYRTIAADPYGTKRDRAHAGQMPDDFKPEWLDAYVKKYNTGTRENFIRFYLEVMGPKPIDSALLREFEVTLREHAIGLYR